MNKFEVVLLFNPELSTNKLNDEINKFKSSLEAHSANIVNEENWGLRELSYSIKKFKKAFYRFFQVETSNSIVKEINRDLTNRELGSLVTNGTVYIECWMKIAKIEKIMKDTKNKKALFDNFKDKL